MSVTQDPSFVKGLRLARRILILVSLPVVAAAIWLGYGRMKFIRSSLRAEGTVVEMVASGGGRSRVPVVSFTDQAGSLQRFTSFTGSRPAVYQVGEKVTVYYDPAAPTRTRLGGFVALWLLPAVLASTGVINLILALVFFVMERKRS